MIEEVFKLSQTKHTRGNELSAEETYKEVKLGVVGPQLGERRK